MKKTVVVIFVLGNLDNFSEARQVITSALEEFHEVEVKTYLETELRGGGFGVVALCSLSGDDDVLRKIEEYLSCLAKKYPYIDNFEVSPLY